MTTPPVTREKDAQAAAAALADLRRRQALWTPVPYPNWRAGG
jgi:hypothetical protein